MRLRAHIFGVSHVQILSPRLETPGSYLAQAYASTRGSAPALRTPVLGSMAMAALEPNDQAPADRNLWPLARSTFWTASGIRDSTDKSPGSLMLCGNTEDA